MPARRVTLDDIPETDHVATSDSGYHLEITMSNGTVYVQQRDDNFHAHIAGHKELWAAGATPYDALGNLVATYPALFTLDGL